MLDLLFGVHVGGWQAIVQFWIWTAALFGILLYWYRKR